MARLYANENFPLQVVQALRGLGHDVLTVAEAGHANQAIPDEEVLAFAIRERSAVITLNRREFILLHSHKSDHTGIIVCAQDPDTDGQARRIHEAITRVDSLAGILLRIDLPWRK